MYRLLKDGETIQETDEILIPNGWKQLKFSKSFLIGRVYYTTFKYSYRRKIKCGHTQTNLFK